jgi:hypothetical protein
MAYEHGLGWVGEQLSPHPFGTVEPFPQLRVGEVAMIEEGALPPYDLAESTIAAERGGVQMQVHAMDSRYTFDDFI